MRSMRFDKRGLTVKASKAGILIREQNDMLRLFGQNFRVKQLNKVLGKESIDFGNATSNSLAKLSGFMGSDKHHLTIQRNSQ